MGKDRKQLLIKTYKKDQIQTPISPDLLREEIVSFSASKGKAGQLRIRIEEKGDGNKFKTSSNPASRKNSMDNEDEERSSLATKFNGIKLK